MAKRIDCTRIAIGMRVVGFEGTWLNHPFWRSRFTVRTDREVRAIRESGVGVLIEEEDAVADPPAPDAQPVVEPPPPAPVAAEPPPPAPRTRARLFRTADQPELRRAAETVRRSRRAVSEMFADARLGRAVKAERVGLLVDEITESVARDASALIRITRLKTKHEYTYMHSVAVSALMINLARELGLDPAETRELGIAGLLHDIGKMAVPDAILDKPGALDGAEYALIRDHPRLGHGLLAQSSGLSTVVLDVCLHHHERVDGTGYPFGLTAAQLSLEARMGAVCDVYDAVTSERAYKSAWSPTDALSRMRDWDGHFDPALLDAFVRSIGIYPRGTLVRLRSNRLAVVVDGNDIEPTLPRVRTFYDTVDRAFLPPDDAFADHAHTRIMGVEDGLRWFGADWDQVIAHVVRAELPPALLNGRASQVVRELGATG